jgi:CheY-like chemotaxis protein
MRKNARTDRQLFVESEGPPQLKTVLLVDTFDDSRNLVRWFLANFGYIVDSVHNAEEALLVFAPAVHDLVVTDYLMSGMNGAEMAHIIKMRSPSTPVIMYSNAPSPDQTGLSATIAKPNRFPFENQLLQMKSMIDDLLLAKSA